MASKSVHTESDITQDVQAGCFSGLFRLRNKSDAKNESSKDRQSQVTQESLSSEAYTSELVSLNVTEQRFLANHIFRCSIVTE